MLAMLTWSGRCRCLGHRRKLLKAIAELNERDARGNIHAIASLRSARAGALPVPAAQA
jgi:hypothetical protein